MKTQFRKVKPRQNEARQKDQARETHHSLLGVLLFLDVQPLGEEVAGAGQHDDAHEEHGDKEEAEEQDAAGVGEGARGEEDPETNQKEADEEFDEGRKEQFHKSFLHVVIF